MESHLMGLGPKTWAVLSYEIIGSELPSNTKVQFSDHEDQRQREKGISAFKPELLFKC